MRGRLALSAFVLAVSGLTAAQRAGLIPLEAVAASPHKIAQGKFWLLLTSGLFADRPTLPSLFALVLFGFVALAVCGSRVLWSAALVGHVGATLLVYYSLALVRVSHPDLFHEVLGRPDIGLSAIFAAWLGATAAVAWRRTRADRRRRIGIVVGCAAIGLIAWLVRPDLTVLDTDHGVAFFIGVGVAGARLRLPRLRLTTRAAASSRAELSLPSPSGPGALPSGRVGARRTPGRPEDGESLR